MKQKILLIGTILAIAAISIPMALQYNSVKIPQSTFDLETHDDLLRKVAELSFVMWENQIFLEINDIFTLTASDPEVVLIRLTPSDMNGVTTGKGTFNGGYTLDFSWPNGTRTYEKFLDDGTLLKSIKIYDEPEKDILIILK